MPPLSPGDPDEADFADLSDPPTSPGSSPSADPSVGGDPPGSPSALPEFAALLAFARKFSQSLTQGSGVASGLAATRRSVVDSFVSWSTPFEGYLNGPYTDALGLITTGMGNLIDTRPASPTPTAKARSLPWSPNNIDADWAILRKAWPGVQSTASMRLTTSRLSPQAMRDLIAGTIRSEEPDILKLLPNFAQAPADAQLAVWSMVWAMGTGNLAKFKQFLQAFNSGDYATAAAQSHMQGVGIDMRNAANKLLLLNAAAVKALGVDPSHLFYLDPIGAVGGLVSAPLRLALRAVPRVDAALLFDAAVVVGCALVGSTVGAVGVVVGLAVATGIVAIHRIKK